MIKKINLLIIMTILIIFIYSLSTAAYFKAEDYRNSLLEIRDTERSLNKLNENLEEADSDFRIIAKADINSKVNEINELYQKQLQAYRNKNDQQVSELAKKIIKSAEQIILATAESKPVQLRAFWLDSGTLAEQKGRAGIQKLLDLAKKANFNAVFPETFYKGLSIIPGNELFTQDPRFSSWEGDPLAILIEEAKKRNIEIHPWVWVFNENTSGSPGRILSENPEWANINKNGEVVSYHNSTWLSPAREDVKDFLQQRYIYLVKNYDLDGINLDYIRFPEEYRGSFGYDQISVEGFKKKYGIDPFEIKSGSSDFALWNDYRESLITKMVKETSSKLKKIDPDLLISADVIPGREEARYRALQNWSLWLEENYLDFVLPMTYTENLFSELNNWIEKDRTVLDKPLYAGISVFKLTSDQVIEQLNEINKINPNGMSLFAAAHLKEIDYQTLAAGVFSKTAVIPHQNKNKSLKILQEFILKRLNIIKKAGKIENSSLIKIRGYLHQILKSDSERIDFNQFLIDNNIELNSEVKRVLEADFSYLNDIKRFY